MNTFESIRQFVVPGDLASQTDEHLRAAGIEGVERFVLWTGVVADDRLSIRTMHVPKQVASRAPQGLYVRVDGDELHRLNRWLFENGQRLAIQVHSHPTDAYHSDLDDAMPIVTTRGGLSLVVPFFGKDGVRGPSTALYRLSQAGWVEVSTAATRTLLQFED